MAGERADVPSTLLAAGPLAHDRRLVALCGARVVTIGDELGPDGLELDVWLARSLPRYAARNFSIEKTVPRDSMYLGGHPKPAIDGHLKTGHHTT